MTLSTDTPATSTPTSTQEGSACPDCGVIKTVDNCYKNGKYLFLRCKNCTLDKAAKDKGGLKKFGLNAKLYTELLEKQGFMCKICGKKHEHKPAVKWGRAHLAVDHSHKTGKIRGLLCHACNVALGLFKDSPETLYRAAEYLQQADEEKDINV